MIGGAIQFYQAYHVTSQVLSRMLCLRLNEPVLTISILQQLLDAPVKFNQTYRASKELKDFNFFAYTRAEVWATSCLHRREDKIIWWKLGDVEQDWKYYRKEDVLKATEEHTIFPKMRESKRYETQICRKKDILVMLLMQQLVHIWLPTVCCTHFTLQILF